MFLLEKISEALLTIGLTFPDWLLLLVFLVSMIMFSLDGRIGLMFLNVSLAFLLVFSALIGIETGKMVFALGISIVLTTLSLYFINRKGVF